MSKAISLTDELNFTKPEQLEEWLKDKPVEWAQVIAVRAALRVLPLVGRVYNNDKLRVDIKHHSILTVLRTQFISSAVRKYPNSDLALKYVENVPNISPASSAAFNSNSVGNDLSGRVKLAANVAYAASMVANAACLSNRNLQENDVFIGTVVDAIARTASAAKGIEVSRSVGAGGVGNSYILVNYGNFPIWAEVSRDCEKLLIRQFGDSFPNRIKLLQTSKLWSKDEPSWIYDHRVELNRALIRQSKHHQVWIDWYSNVLNGKPFFDLSTAREKELTLKIAQQENEFWEQDFAKVSKDISGWLEQARIDEVGDAEQQRLDEGENETASVPPKKPASVQPVWVNGRLVQSTAPMHAELQDELLAAFAEALRKEIAALANAAQQSNFDKRGLALLAETANLMPDAKPDSVLLFQLIFREAQLSDQIDLIKGQWPETLSTRYCTLLRQLRDYLDRFSERRQFNRDKLETDLEDIDFDDLDRDVSDFGNVLRSDDVNVIVDVSIPNALDSIGAVPENKQSIEIQSDATGRSTQIVKAADQIESINNISRELVELFGEDNADFFEAGKAAYIQGARENYVGASYEAGREDALKIAKLANRGAIGLAAGKSIWNRLGEKYPKVFGWMKRGDR